MTTAWLKCSIQEPQIFQYDADLTQRCTSERHALESNPLSTKIFSIHHQVRVDTLVKYVRRKLSHQALTEYLIFNS